MTLSAEAIRRSWLAERDSMRGFLTEKKFNPQSADKFISNFIESMVFARIPCTSRGGILAAAKQHAKERL